MKVLVVVDVQKEYSSNFTMDYLNRLEKYVEEHRAKYDKVIVVFQDPELHEDDGHYTLPTLCDQADLFIEKWFYLIDEDWLQQVKNEGNPFELNERGYLEDTHGNVIMKVKRDIPDIEEEDFLPPYELINLAKSLAQGDVVDLCGGGKGHCLADVKSVFDYFGVDNRILEDLTYSLHENEKILAGYNWVEVPKEKTIYM